MKPKSRGFQKKEPATEALATLSMVFERRQWAYRLCVVLAACSVVSSFANLPGFDRSAMINGLMIFVRAAVTLKTINYFLHPLKITIDTENVTIAPMRMLGNFSHRPFIRPLSEFNAVAMKHVSDLRMGIAVGYICNRLVLNVAVAPVVPWYRYAYAPRYRDGDVILIERWWLFKSDQKRGKQLAKLTGLSFRDYRKRGY
jgi:hypothetical protein